MKSKLVIAILLCNAISSTPLKGQQYCDQLYDNQWVFGGRENNDTTDIFGGSIISFLPEYSMSLRHKRCRQSSSFAVVNSLSGKLLFYTNGCMVFDHCDSIVKNGSELNPGEVYDEYCPDNFGYPGLHNMFFLPSAYDSSIFYLFHIGEINNREPNAAFIVQFDKYYITTIHSTLDNGFPEVIDKNKIIFTDTGMIGMPSTAVRHANGLDWWAITPDRWNSGFHTVLLDQDGPHYLGKQYIGQATNPYADGGQGKFSPDGAHFAWYQPRNGVFLYDFDRSTGMLSNFRSIAVPTAADLVTGGLEFSPSGRFLYINHYFSLYQIDMLADDLQSSLTHIADYDGFGSSPFFTVFYHMERTPDNRIFMNPRTGSQWLHVIQEPEKKGAACRFEQHIIKLPTVNNLSLPHFPNYRLGALGDPLCDSVIVSTGPYPASFTRICMLSPNPASEEINIVCDKEVRHIAIHNITGATMITIHTQEDETLSVDVSTWPSGVYFVSIDAGDQGLFTKKLVITR